LCFGRTFSPTYRPQYRSPGRPPSTRLILTCARPTPPRRELDGAAKSPKPLRSRQPTSTLAASSIIRATIQCPDRRIPAAFAPTAACPILSYESAGLYDQNQMIAISISRSKVLPLRVLTLSYADSNTPGNAGFPMNQYHLRRLWTGRLERPSTRVRRPSPGSWAAVGICHEDSGLSLHRRQFRPPFDITLGQDLNGDSIYNDRPAFASSLSNPVQRRQHSLGQL